MKRFGRAACACRRAAASIVLSRVVDEQRRDLERDPAVDAAGRVVDRPEQVGGARQVVAAASAKNRSSPERPARASSAICSS